MKRISLQRFARSFPLYLAFGVVAACSPSEPAPGKKPPATDPQGRPYFPCSGDLCFKGVEEADPKDLDTLKQLLDEKEFQEAIDELAEKYAACNYYRGPSGFVEVDCPDWVDVYGCPGQFFNFLNRYDRVLLSRSDPHHYYCLGEQPTKDHHCSGRWQCPEGQVCSGSLTHDLMGLAHNPVDRSPTCVSGADCLALEHIEAHRGEDSCFYADFTRPTTGRPAEQDCNALNVGECAINCPCPVGVSNEQHETSEAACHFVSETRPIGICGTNRCQLDDPCLPLGHVCAIVQPPTWARTFADAYAQRTDSRPDLEDGVCVPRENCEAWAAREPGVVSCHSALP